MLGGVEAKEEVEYVFIMPRALQTGSHRLPSLSICRERRTYQDLTFGPSPKNAT